MKNIFSKIKTLFWVIATIKNWQLWLALYFHLLDRGKERMIILRNGQKFLVADDEFFPFKEVLGDKAYIKKHCGEILRNSEAVIIDLGANIGLFSILVAALNKNAKIYAYEPAPSFRRFIKNIKINGLAKCIRAFNLGAAGKAGIRKLFLYPSRSIGSSLLNKGRGGAKKESVNVKVTTLDHIFKDNQIDKCDFLKIDVEGAEYEILLKCPSSCLRKIKAMAIEYHQGFAKLKKFLENNRFSVVVRRDPYYSNLGMLYAKLVI